MNVAESAPVAEASPSRWSAGLAGVRAFRVVLWLLVVAGPVMAAWASAQVAAANRYLEARLEVEAAPPVVSTAAAEGFAELAVADFLSHGHDRSGDYENEASIRP